MRAVLIISIVSFAFGLGNGVWNMLAQRQANEQRLEQSQLHEDFKSAKIQQLITDEKVKRLVDDFAQVQDSLKVLSFQNIKMREDLRKAETNYLVLKNSLKVKTNYRDSSDFSIIKNLPK